MTNQKRSKLRLAKRPAKATLLPEQRVTLAFQRTFVEGMYDGLTIDLRRQVGASEAMQLISEGFTWSSDGDGARGVDSFIRIAEYA